MSWACTTFTLTCQKKPHLFRTTLTLIIIFTGVWWMFFLLPPPATVQMRDWHWDRGDAGWRLQTPDGARGEDQGQCQPGNRRGETRKRRGNPSETRTGLFVCLPSPSVLKYISLPPWSVILYTGCNFGASTLINRTITSSFPRCDTASPTWGTRVGFFWTFRTVLSWCVSLI